MPNFFLLRFRFILRKNRILRLSLICYLFITYPFPLKYMIFFFCISCWHVSVNDVFLTYKCKLKTITAWKLKLLITRKLLISDKNIIAERHLSIGYYTRLRVQKHQNLILWGYWHFIFSMVLCLIKIMIDSHR